MSFGRQKSTQNDLERVEIALATMGGAVEQQVADAISAFERHDVALAHDVWQRDSDIDAHERAIEHQVVGILEERRPTGVALRRAMTAVKIAAEMERVGDLAKNIAKRTTVMVADDDFAAVSKVIPGVARMGRRALTQFKEGLDSLFHENPAAARAVREADDQIDVLYNSIFREILVSMGQYTSGLVVGTHMVFVAKNFERIGDHATNVAERVHFSLTGEELLGARTKRDMTSLASMDASGWSPGLRGDV